MDQLQREKLAKQIEASPLDNPTRQQLISRLKVASHEGCAAVIRDFEAGMEKYRREKLPSYRRTHPGAPMNKAALILHAK